jgi:hypothetical protein
LELGVFSGKNSKWSWFFGSETVWRVVPNTPYIYTLYLMLDLNRCQWERDAIENLETRVN